ncbi:hypothetical protein ACP4OV_012666 [Aristida adscensionis]
MLPQVPLRPAPAARVPARRQLMATAAGTGGAAGPALRTCRNCKRQYDPAAKHPSACRFHTAHFGATARILWLGYLNYRIDLLYERAHELITTSNWSQMAEMDQLKRKLKKEWAFDWWTGGDWIGSHAAALGCYLAMAVVEMAATPSMAALVTFSMQWRQPWRWWQQPCRRSHTMLSICIQDEHAALNSIAGILSLLQSLVLLPEEYGEI